MSEQNPNVGMSAAQPNPATSGSPRSSLPPPPKLYFYDVATDANRDLRTGKKIEAPHGWLYTGEWLGQRARELRSEWLGPRARELRSDGAIGGPYEWAAIELVRALLSERDMQPPAEPERQQPQERSARMTLGEFRVGLDFNPSGNRMVSDLKIKAARFIDAVIVIPKQDGIDGTADEVNNEIGRLKSLAMTHAEDAAMWAVKAATKRPR